MIASAALLAILTVFLMAGWLAGELRFLAPYKTLLFHEHAALIGWAKSMGEASDYTDNAPLQCLHPVGHWYEVPNLFRNGAVRYWNLSQLKLVNQPLNKFGVTIRKTKCARSFRSFGRSFRFGKRLDTDAVGWRRMKAFGIFVSQPFGRFFRVDSGRECFESFVLRVLHLRDQP